MLAISPGTHASRHITAGLDEIDGDKLDVDWNPSNYTPATTPAEADSVDNLTAHLFGIDQVLAISPGTHAARHITGGLDQIDGDKLDVDWNPSNYTPATTPAEADSVDNLTAHLFGIDQVLAISPGTHAPRHITGGLDQVDGDKLDIDWNPSNYTPDTTPAEADSNDNLTAHLYGVDQAIGSNQSTATAHAARHLRTGADEIDADKLDIDWNPSYYTPATTPAEVSNVDELTAHLYGIDQVLAGVPEQYDSDWFAVAASTAYNKIHGLSGVPQTVQVYWANGTGATVDRTLVTAVLDSPAVGEAGPFAVSPYQYVDQTQVRLESGDHGTAATCLSATTLSSVGYWRVHAFYYQ